VLPKFSFFFCFCEETIQFDAGKAEVCAIKARGILFDEKVNFKWTLFSWSKVDESPNKHFLLVPSHEKDVYFCKSELWEHQVVRFPVPKVSNLVEA
jgi:hypothetical protein